ASLTEPGGLGFRASLTEPGGLGFRASLTEPGGLGFRASLTEPGGLGLRASQVSLQEVGSESNFLSKWTGSPASRSSEELDAWTDFRSRTNSNASTLSGRLSPILANLEPDEGLEEGTHSPPSPMLFSSSSSSISPSTLSDLNLNDMVSGNMLDNVAARQPNEQEEGDACSVFGFSGAESSPSALFTPPCIALRTAPMQTIQENKQTWFSSVCSAQALYSLDLQSHDLLTPSDPLMSQAGRDLQSHDLLTPSDPLMSQAGRDLQSHDLLTPSDPLMSQAGRDLQSHDLLTPSDPLMSQAGRDLQSHDLLTPSDPLMSQAGRDLQSHDLLTPSDPLMSQAGRDLQSHDLLTPSDPLMSQAGRDLQSHDLLTPSDPLMSQAGRDLQSHDLLTPSDPLMSQAGAAAIALQTSRRNATILHKKDPEETDADPVPKPPVKLTSDLHLDAIIRNELMDADCLDLSFDSRLAAVS
ncbi:hypothetical protein KUCAC02_035029, partial [Chaenocephalus aceratus]